MSRIRNVEGTITKNTGGNQYMYSEGIISFNTLEFITDTAPEHTYGDPKDPPVREQKNKIIKNAYWSDKNQNKINCLLYSVKTVYVCVNLLKKAKGKKVSITYKEYNTVFNTNLNRDTDYLITNDNLQQFFPITFTIDDYTKEDEDDIAEYIFELKIDDEEYINNIEKLKVHAVIYIPEIMKSLGWNYAFKSQEDWFSGKKNNYPWESEPKIDDFNMGWALRFERIKKHYNENLNKWQTTESLESLKKEIGKMVKDGYGSYPTLKVKLTTFGLQNINDAQLVDLTIKPDEFKKNDIKTVKTKVPLFDKYYFTSAIYEESKLFPNLDDFYGSIANCNIRFTAKGTMKYKDIDYIEVMITEIGVYIRDGFDYSGDQPLGYWSLKDKNLTINPLNGNYRYINNESYRDYRKDSGMGGDSYRYSNMYIYKPNFKFKL